MSNPHEPTDDVLTALALATEDELVSELARRAKGIVYARIRLSRDGLTEETVTLWRGGFVQAMGLAERMRNRLREHDAGRGAPPEKLE